MYGCRLCQVFLLTHALLCPGGQDTRTLKPVDSRQCFQQCFGILEVNSVKALGEPAVNLCQKLVCFCPLALLLPQPTQARRGAQLQRFRLLAVGYGKGLM